MVYVKRHDGEGIGGRGAETGDAVVFFGVEGRYCEGFVEELGVCCCCHFGWFCVLSQASGFKGRELEKWWVEGLEEGAVVVEEGRCSKF